MILQKGRLFFGQISSCFRLSSLVSRLFEETKGPGDNQRRHREGAARLLIIIGGGRKLCLGEGAKINNCA